MKRTSDKLVIFSFIILFFISCSIPMTYMPAGIYYVDSETGNDDNSGLSEDYAFKSLAKINSCIFAPGSEILFKSGLTFRGSIFPSSGDSASNVTYSSYGGDEYAVIQNSVDLSSSALWINTGSNLWKADFKFTTEVGNIIFEDESCGIRKWSKGDLAADDDFYFDRFWKKLYLKSSVNPAENHTSIEAAISSHIVDFSNTSFAEFSNLHFRYGAAHGFGGGNTSNIRIYDCELSFIGGGYLYEKDGEPVRYGNGIEFWGEAVNNTVENCYIHDIYDTALTNQNHSSSVVQKNLTYRNNILENCALASFEFWNQESSSTMDNIIFEYNTSINPGSGWGKQRPDINGSHVAEFGNLAALNQIIFRYNIFYGGNVVFFLDEATFNSAEFYSESNCLFPVEDSDWDYLAVIWDNSSLDTSTKYTAYELSKLQQDSGRESGSNSSDPDFIELNYPYSLNIGSTSTGLGASVF